MLGWSTAVKSTLLATLALMVVVGALATANAAPDPANRYRAVQISEEDVILQEPQIQAVLQTPDFHLMLQEGSLGEALERSGYSRDPSAPKGGILPWAFDSVLEASRGQSHDQAYRLPAAGLNRIVPGRRAISVDPPPPSLR